MPAANRQRVKAASDPSAPPPGLERGMHPLETRLAQLSTIDIDQRTVEVTWTTGAAVRRRRYDYTRGCYVDYDEVLKVSPAAINMEHLKDGAPVLDSHSMWSTEYQRAVVDKAWLEGGEGRAILRFPKAGIDEAADRLLSFVADKIIRKISVGYSTDKVRIDPPKKDGDVETRTVEQWTPYELSFVTIGADPGAKVRGADHAETRTFPISFIGSPPETEERSMPEEKNPGAAETGAPTETREKPAAAAQPAAAQPAAHAPADQAAAVTRGVQLEMQRRDAIEGIARQHRLGEDFIKKHRDANSTLDQVREAVLAELQKRDAGDSGQSQVSDPARVTRSADEKFFEGAANAIIVRSGAEAIVRQAQGKDAKPLDPGNFRGFSLIDLAREHLELQGVRTRGMDRERVFREMMKRSISIRAAGVGFGAQGTGDFSVVLESAMHKVMLGAYAVTPDTWTRFCKQGSVTDLRIHNRYRLGSFGSLDSLNEFGEFKQKSIPDGEKYTIKASTKGNIIGLTREAIINDDLGAFSDLATMFGRAAKLSIEKDVYASLALNSNLGPTLGDGVAMFNSAHNNIAATGVISVAVFDDIGVKMGSQKDVSNNEVLDLKPKVLLVPLGSRGEAIVINGAEYDPDTSGKLQRPNKVRGLFSDIVGTARISGTRVYAFADPAIAPAFEVAFLNGQTEPFLDNDEGWRMDGMEWKVRLDYGVAGQDYRGAVTAAGA